MKNKLNFLTKGFLIKTLAVLMMIGMMDSSAFSQRRIRFAKGKSSTTISGTVVAGGSSSYVFGGRDGQTLLVRADSRSTAFGVEVDGVYDADGLYALLSTGDHTIVVYNNGSRSAKFTMYIEIR